MIYILNSINNDASNIGSIFYRAAQQQGAPVSSSQDQIETGLNKTSKDTVELSRQSQNVRTLQRNEEKVIAHENAHMAAGGQFAGAASYEYTRGPDGKNYINGGEVSISLKPGRTPRETISNMEQVRRAALAPADPSSQDLSVAAAAARLEMKAAAQLRKGTTQSKSNLDILI